MELGGEQAHYLLDVMRVTEGDDVLLFNGTDGEWRCRVQVAAKRTIILGVEEQTRSQPTDVDEGPWLLFAPLKRTATDFLVQKATELGVGRLIPVMTSRTVNRTVRTDRLEKIAIEAAEQCERLDVPAIDEPVDLPSLLADWSPARQLILCAEAGPAFPLAKALPEMASKSLAVLIGPEGGFSKEERQKLAGTPFVTAVSLGPRILKAETAAIAALAIVQSLVGDGAQERAVFREI